MSAQLFGPTGFVRDAFNPFGSSTAILIFTTPAGREPDTVQGSGQHKNGRHSSGNSRACHHLPPES